jgi:nitronate monooxygenase
MMSGSAKESTLNPPVERFDLFAGLRLPVIVAPMFLISGPDVVIAATKAGIAGAFPAANARTIDDLKGWFRRITGELTGPERGRWAVNLNVHRSYDRFIAELDLVLEFRVPVVITALGDPARVLEPVHRYDGLVLADVINSDQARRAVDKGVDGLVLVCAGAGGHTGTFNPFSFVDEVRSFWDGVLVLAGGISSGHGIRAALALGADLVYMGTRFIVAPETLVSDEYRAMLVRTTIEGIVTSAEVSGVPANWLRESLETAGIVVGTAVGTPAIDFSSQKSAARAWKNIWGAGHGVGAIRAVESVKTIVDQLHDEFMSTPPRASDSSAIR